MGLCARVCWGLGRRCGCDAENAATQPYYMRVDVGGMIGARVTVRARADLDDVADVNGIAWETPEEKVKA